MGKVATGLLLAGTIIVAYNIAGARAKPQTVGANVQVSIGGETDTTGKCLGKEKKCEKTPKKCCPGLQCLWAGGPFPIMVCGKPRVIPPTVLADVQVSIGGETDTTGKCLGKEKKCEKTPKKCCPGLQCLRAGGPFPIQVCGKPRVIPPTVLADDQVSVGGATGQCAAVYERCDRHADCVKHPEECCCEGLYCNGSYCVHAHGKQVRKMLLDLAPKRLDGSD